MCDYRTITHNIKNDEKNIATSLCALDMHTFTLWCVFPPVSKLGLGNLFDVCIRSAEPAGEDRFVDRNNINKDLNL